MKILSHIFDSFDAFNRAASLPGIDGAMRCASRDTGDYETSWTLTESFEEALLLSQEGDSLREARVAALSEKAKDRAIDAMRQGAETFGSSFDIAGDDADVSRFLSGDPENMLQYIPMPAESGNRHVRIVCNAAYGSKIPAQTIEQNGAAVAALVDCLESQGYRCEVWATVIVAPGREGVVSLSEGFSHWGVLVKVKAADEALDTTRLVYSCVHPSFLRRHVLSLMETESATRQQWLAFTHGVPQVRCKDHCEAIFPQWTGDQTIYCESVDIESRATIDSSVQWIIDTCGQIAQGGGK